MLQFVALVKSLAYGLNENIGDVKDTCQEGDEFVGDGVDAE